MIPRDGTILGRLLRTPRAVFGGVVLLVVLACALGADWMMPFDSEAMDFDSLLAGPSWPHVLGTDQLAATPSRA